MATTNPKMVVYLIAKSDQFAAIQLRTVYEAVTWDILKMERITGNNIDCVFIRGSWEGVTNGT